MKTILIAFCLAWGATICIAAGVALGGSLSRRKPKINPVKLTRLNDQLITKL